MSTTNRIQEFDNLILALNKIIFGKGDVTLNGSIKPTIDKFLKSIAANGWYEEPFLTESDLLQSTSTKSRAVAKALDTKKVFYWNGSSWVDTGLSELDLAKIYTDHRLRNLTDFGLLDYAFTTDYAFTIEDKYGRAPFRITYSGATQADILIVDKINGIGKTKLETVNYLGVSAERYAFAVSDGSDRVSFAVLNDGTTKVASLEVDRVNGLPIDDLLAGSKKSFGNFNAELVFFNNTGQSLGEGSDGDITTTQEYDNIGFPALSTDPTTFLPLTVANTQVHHEIHGNRHESPMYAALGIIKERILADYGVNYTEQKYQLLAANNAISALSIQALSKGSTSYNAAISQAQAGYNIAQNEGRTFKAGAVFWTQGESNGGTDPTIYANLLKQYIADYNADIKSITGQSDRVILICCQTAAAINSALGQLKAHDTSADVFVATPIYFLNTYDGLHIKAYGAKILGGFYGLAYKRVVLDGEDWQPLKPISHTKQGKILNIKFNVPTAPIVFDTSAVAAKTNMGFTLVDSLDNPIAINSVSIINFDTVKIVADTPVPIGAKLRYAYAGGGGNLRDSQGNDITYYDTPMHNYCVHFEYNV